MDAEVYEDNETTEAEWNEILDSAARLYLGVSREEFLARLQSGDTDDFDHVRLMRVLALVPRRLRGGQNAA